MKKNVIIIGAGPAGLSFAKSLADTNLDIVVIEKKEEKDISCPEYDGREIALTHLSKKIMQKLGAWNSIPEEEISLIKEAKVLDGQSHHALHFDNKKIHVDALGYLISNHQIRKSLYEEVSSSSNIKIQFGKDIISVNTADDNASVKLSDGTVIEADLIVAADSRFSETRRNMGISASMHDFGRVAIVFNMKIELPHNDTAYEYFTYGRTLALLPKKNNLASIVITVSAKEAESLLATGEDLFNKIVQNYLQNDFGEMKLATKRYSYPLVAVYANNFISKRFAVIGDASVGMHPVTAHGFNLGLSGQNILSSQIKKALEQNKDIGSDDVLEVYQTKHKRASKGLYLGTNAIVKLYTDDRILPKILRKAILRIGNNFIPAKMFLMNKLTGVKETI